MSQTLTIFKHTHNWKPWLQRYSVFNGITYKTKTRKIYKCWKCGSLSEDKTPETMPSYKELQEEFLRLKGLAR